MPFEAWFAVAVTLFCILLLASNRHSADVVLLGGVTLLLVFGVITPQQALGGLANEGMVTVGALYVVVAGLQETGAVAWMADTILGQPRSLRHGQWRLALPILALSPFLNNTPVVAMFIPAVAAWCKRHRLPIPLLMMPLAFLTTAAGLCTLVGSSTNLVVNGLLRAKTDSPGFSLWELAQVGAPVTLTVLLYILFASPRLLPNRSLAAASFENVREYTVEMIVEEGGRLAGKTIQEAELRHLPGLFLVHVQRNGDLLPAVSPNERLQGGDRLLFTGQVASVADLRNFRGLSPATDQVFKLDTPVHNRILAEAVVSDACPLVGKSVRAGRFRTHFNAVILAVARNGEKLPGKVGDVILWPGDTLLLEAPPAFLEQQRRHLDFYLVREVENYHPVRHHLAPVALLILLAFVAASASGWVSTLEAALLAAGGMILTRCLSGGSARQAVEWPVLLVIAASFALGSALESTGAARSLARELVALARGDAWSSLAAVYGVTAFLTLAVTNNATAVIMFPIALAASRDLGVSFTPFAVAVLVAASACFATPIGYQTNLMVQGPGGYRFGDYVRFGLPLTVLVGAVTVLVVPLVWSF